MLILECSQGCYGRTDGSVTISLRNFVGKEITKIQPILIQLSRLSMDTIPEPLNRIGGVMVSVLVSIVVDYGFKPQSG